jgi:hypothetical protein
MQVEALVADGCPKVWVVTSDALEQQLAHGEVCSLPFRDMLFIYLYQLLDLLCTTLCAYSLYSRISYKVSWNAYCTFQYLNTKEVFASFFS